jgi:hypothetical protein
LNYVFYKRELIIEVSKMLWNSDEFLLAEWEWKPSGIENRWNRGVGGVWEAKRKL